MRKRKADNLSHNDGKKYTTTVGFLSLSIAFLLGYLLSSIGRNDDPSLRGSIDCSISIGDTKYKGTQYTTRATIGTPKCLLESKFLKVQQHRVQMEGDNEVIEDWLWIDYHDRINVLIEAPKSNNNDKNGHEPHFIILEQTKYALEGRTSLAIVGGIIEPGEAPDEAARREVLEETGHKCEKLDFLGRYRTDVNRGMGWTNAYVASMCFKKKSTTTDHNALSPVDEVGKTDMEKQTLITLSMTEVREAVMAGRFLEIQWSATVALALLLYDKRVDSG